MCDLIKCPNDSCGNYTKYEFLQFELTITNSIPMNLKSIIYHWTCNFCKQYIAINAIELSKLVHQTVE